MTEPEASGDKIPSSPPILALPESAPPPPPADLASGIGQHSIFLLPKQIQNIISAAVHQSLAAQFRPPSRALSVASGASASRLADCREDALQGAAPDSPISTGSQVSSLAEAELHEFDLSEDEGLPPDQPAFTGLFPQALFKSLLFKAVNTAGLRPPFPAQMPTPAAHGALDPLFAEPPKAVDSIPTPPLFLDVIRKQWISPGAAPTPSTMDKKNFNVASELASLLQVPSVDSPIAALLPNAAIPGDPDEGLRPDELHSDQVLQRAYQGAAWAIRSASTASFFNRATLLWLCQLQDNLTTEDIRVKQDLNKIIAAIQFSADSTLNVA